MYLRYGSALEWEDVRALPQELLKIVITIAYFYIGYYVLWQPVWMSGMRLRSALVGSLGTAFAARIARLPLPVALYSWKL